jgi:hypothetical protein
LGTVASSQAGAWWDLEGAVLHWNDVVRAPHFSTPGDPLDKPREFRLPYKPTLDNPGINHFTTSHAPPGS